MIIQFNIILILSAIYYAISYSCDSSTCKLPSCKCPSPLPPGNLSVSQTPQLILLTYDVYIIIYINI